MVKKEKKSQAASSSSKNSSVRAVKIARQSIGEKNTSLLKTLCYLKKNQRTAFLRTVDNNLIKCIQECVFNTLKGNVPLGSSEKKRLAKHKSILRRIAAKKGGLKVKRKLLVQHGGFLPYLIVPILEVILSRFIGD